MFLKHEGAGRGVMGEWVKLTPHKKCPQKAQPY